MPRLQVSPCQKEIATNSLSQATDQYWQHIIPIVWLALLIHVGLIFLFLSMSIPTLAIFNIFSVMVCISIA